MSVGTRRAAAAAVVVALLLAGCGGGGGSSRRFSSPRVPFTFEYPAALRSCGAFGGSIAVLGWCSSEATFGITATDYVSVGRFEPRTVPLSTVRARLARLIPNAWRSVDIERHSGMSMVVARGQRRSGYPYSAYLFPLAGATWRLDCASSPTHLKDSLAACRQAVGSIRPR